MVSSYVHKRRSDRPQKIVSHAEADQAGIEELRAENEKLRHLVVQLSKIIIRNVMDQK